HLPAHTRSRLQVFWLPGTSLLHPARSYPEKQRSRPAEWGFPPNQYFQRSAQASNSRKSRSRRSRSHTAPRPWRPTALQRRTRQESESAVSRGESLGVFWFYVTCSPAADALSSFEKKADRFSLHSTCTSKACAMAIPTGTLKHR